MEDVLDVYTRPYDPQRPQVCLDETSRQLLADVAPPQPMAPGVTAKEDYEYVRQGVVNLFMVCEPLRGWREVMVSDRRTRIDWAQCIEELFDVHYPDADKIVLVQLAVCVVFGRSQSVRAYGNEPRKASMAVQLYLP